MATDDNGQADDAGSDLLRRMVDPPDPARAALDAAHAVALERSVDLGQTGDEAAVAAHEWLTEQGYDANAIAGHLDDHEAAVARASVGRALDDGRPVSLAEWAYATAARARQDQRAVTEGWATLGHSVLDENGLPTRRHRFGAIHARGLAQDNDFVAWDLRHRGPQRPQPGGHRAPVSSDHGKPSPHDAMNAALRKAGRKSQFRHPDVGANVADFF